MGFLKKMFGWLTKYFSTRAEADLAKTRDLVGIALPIVELVTKLTPTRADDEIIALFKQFALPHVDAFLALPRDKRGLALLDVASTLLARQEPGVASRILHTAVQLAYTIFSAEKQS